MKVKDLIAKLQNMPQDLEVYAYCDHGQTPETTCAPQVRYASVDDYNSGLEHMGYDKADDAEEGSGVVAFVIL